METSEKSFALRVRGAFTLMEVLLAIAMISLLAFLVVGNLDTIMSTSQTKIAQSAVNDTFATPLITFKVAIGRYPTTEEGLNALVTAPESLAERWKKPFAKSIPLDPWGNAYSYRCPPQKSNVGYDIWSNGPDGQPDTDDDIGNW